MSRMSFIVCIFIASLLVIPYSSHAASIHYAVTGYAYTHDWTVLPITGSMIIDEKIRWWEDLSPVDIHSPVNEGDHIYVIESFDLSIGPYSMSGIKGSLNYVIESVMSDYDFYVGDLMWFLYGDHTSAWNYWVGEYVEFYNSDLSPVEINDYYFSLPDIIVLSESIINKSASDDPILSEYNFADMWLIKQNYPVSVPEPVTALLLGSGLAGLALYRRRMK